MSHHKKLKESKREKNEDGCQKNEWQKWKIDDVNGYDENDLLYSDCVVYDTDCCILDDEKVMKRMIIS